MLANVQIFKNGLSCNNCFHISVKDHQLTMGYIGGAIKSDFIIPFTEMDNLALIHWHGSQQITFSYQDLSFEFIENGFGEINYLKNILFQNSMIK